MDALSTLPEPIAGPSSPRRASADKDKAQEVIHGDAGQAQDESPKKRARRKPAKLERLISSAPVEILHNVFAHCEPGTLLKLSRTCEAFADILLGESSTPIWLSARRMVGLSFDFKVGASELSIATLVFERACTDCGRTDKLLDPDFHIMKCYCTDCAQPTYKKWRRSKAAQTPLPPVRSVATRRSARAGEEWEQRREKWQRATEAEAAVMEWEKRKAAERKARTERMHRERKEALEVRLLSEGLSMEHIKLAAEVDGDYIKFAKQLAPLTDKVWETNKATLVAAVARAQLASVVYYSD